LVKIQILQSRRGHAKIIILYLQWEPIV
jgi:hypothetical protein